MSRPHLGDSGDSQEWSDVEGDSGLTDGAAFLLNLDYAEVNVGVQS